MKEIVQFVSTSIASGIVGSVAYDGLKVVLGSSFDKLSSYLSNNQEKKFEDTLEMLLEQNEELKQQIIELQQGKNANIIINGNIKGVGVAQNGSVINQIIS